MRLTKKTENERMWNGHQTSTISLPTTSAKRKDSSTNEEHNNIKYIHTIQLATKDYNFFKKR